MKQGCNSVPFQPDNVSPTLGIWSWWTWSSPSEHSREPSSCPRAGPKWAAATEAGLKPNIKQRDGCISPKWATETSDAPSPQQWNNCPSEASWQRIGRLVSTAANKQRKLPVWIRDINSKIVHS